MGKLYKRGETYWADYWSNGHRVRTSLRTSDRAVAKARLRDAELGTTSEAPHAAKALGDAIDEMVALKKGTTAQSYREHAGHIFRLIGADADINALTRARVSDYCADRLKEGASRHTVHKELVVLRQALKESKAREEFTGSLEVVPPWKAEYEPETRWLTVAEFGRLLGAVDPKRRTWLMLQAYTGAELSAMRRLTWEHVNLQRGTITIPGTKRHSRFRVDLPMHPVLQAWIKRCCRTAPLVQPWPKVHRDMRAACIKARIDPPATTHDLRRTFGSWLVQAGVDVHHVARLMGNTYNMVARVYGQTSDASYAAAVNKLPKVKSARRSK